MLTWDELKDDDIIPYRTPLIENKYQIFKDNNSLIDIIRNNLIKDKSKDLHLTINNYPYDVEDDVSHYIIWDLNEEPLEIDSQLSRYRKFAESNFNPDIYDMIIKINKIGYQSIPEIKHSHLFIRKKMI